MVSEKEFRKQIREAYYEGRPKTKTYITILAVLVILIIAVTILSTQVPSEITTITNERESQIVEERMKQRAEESLALINGLREGPSS